MSVRFSFEGTQRWECHIMWLVAMAALPPLRNGGIGWMSYFSDFSVGSCTKMYHIRVHFQLVLHSSTTMKAHGKNHWDAYEASWSSKIFAVTSRWFHCNHWTSCGSVETSMPRIERSFFCQNRALQSHRLRSNMAHLWMLISSFEAHLCFGTWSSPSLNLEFLVVLHQYHLNRGSPTSTKTLNVIPAVRYASLGITVWSSRRWSRALGRVKHLNSLELGILAALAMQFRSGQIMLKFTKPTVHGRNPKQPPGM